MRWLNLGVAGLGCLAGLTAAGLLCPGWNGFADDWTVQVLAGSPLLLLAAVWLDRRPDPVARLDHLLAGLFTLGVNACWVVSGAESKGFITTSGWASLPAVCGTLAPAGLAVALFVPAAVARWRPAHPPGAADAGATN